MDVVIERCAGLDVHKKTVVACVRTPGRDQRTFRSRKIRTFPTSLKGLKALRVYRFRFPGQGDGLNIMPPSG